MFGNNNKEKSAPMGKAATSSTGSAALNSLVQGTEIDGKLTTTNDIRIDGIVRGSIVCEGKVIIGATGTVDGDITCSNAIIEGKFYGTILVKDLLNVRQSAVIEGEITTTKLVVESGAIFNVTCRMGNQTNHETVITRKPTAKVAALKKEAS